MNAADVMTRDVITVSPDDLVQDVAGVLLKNRISAAPVVDAKGKLVGIVSEGDLMHRTETGTDTQRSWWLRMIAGRETLAAEYVKSHARRAADVMTEKVIAVRPDAALRNVATLLDKHHIKRVPVVENGQLIGIVSRANLVQALASIHAQAAGSDKVEDTALRERIIGQLKAERWTNLATLNILVHEGVVELWGAVDSEAEHRAVRIAAENTPGVLAVQDHLILQQIPGGAV